MGVREIRDFLARGKFGCGPAAVILAAMPHQWATGENREGDKAKRRARRPAYS